MTKYKKVPVAYIIPFTIYTIKYQLQVFRLPLYIVTILKQRLNRSVSQTIKDTPWPTQLTNCLKLGEIFLHAHPQVIYYNCVKFHQYSFIC